MNATFFLFLVIGLIGFIFLIIYGVNIANNWRSIIGYVLIAISIAGIVYFAFQGILHSFDSLMPKFKT